MNYRGSPVSLGSQNNDSHSEQARVVSCHNSDSTRPGKPSLHLLV